MRYLRISLLNLLIALVGCAVLDGTDGELIGSAEPASTSAEEQADSPQLSEEIRMKEAIELYVQGANEQRIDVVKDVLHDDFQVVAYREGAVRSIRKQTYLELLEAGKIGGSKRQIRYLDLYIDNVVGTARVNLVGEGVTFHDHLSLIKQEGGWKVVSNVTYVSQN